MIHVASKLKISSLAVNRLMIQITDEKGTTVYLSGQPERQLRAISVEIK